MSKIYVICPDDNTTCGGVKQLYRHVDVLNANDISASILHYRKGFRCTFFKNRTKIANMQTTRLDNDDILIVPEINGPQMHMIAPGVKKVSFVQNGYFFFQGFPFDGPIDYAYNNKDIIACYSISDDTTAQLNHIFEHLGRDLPIYRIYNSVDSKLFYYDESQKKNQIAVMPRRGTLDLREVLNTLRYRGALQDWDIKLIDKMPEAEVAKTLRESRIFLSSGYLEGLPLPVMEAMAAGCAVIGYHGQGARELFKSDGCLEINVGDIRNFALAVEQGIITEIEQPGRIAEIGKINADFILDKYNDKVEADSIIQATQAILERV